MGALMSISVVYIKKNPPLLVATAAATLAISGYGCMWTMQGFNAIKYTEPMGVANGALVVFLLTLAIGYASYHFNESSTTLIRAMTAIGTTSCVLGTGAM